METPGRVLRRPCGLPSLERIAGPAAKLAALGQRGRTSPVSPSSLSGAKGILIRAMDTVIPDRYAGEHQIGKRPDAGHGPRRYCGRFLGSTKFGQMIDDKGVVDGRIVMGGSTDGKLSVFSAPYF